MTNANIDAGPNRRQRWPIASIAWPFIPFAPLILILSLSIASEMRKTRAINAHSHACMHSRATVLHVREWGHVHVHCSHPSARMAAPLSIPAAFIISALCLRLRLRPCGVSRFVVPFRLFPPCALFFHLSLRTLPFRENDGRFARMRAHSRGWRDISSASRNRNYRTIRA